jgi:cell division protein FtsB
MIGPDAPTTRAARTPAPDGSTPGVRPLGRTGRIARYILVTVTVVLLVDAVVGEKGMLALLQARKQFAAVERALEQSRDDNASLRQTARRLREDPTAIEAVARKELGLIKPGEKVFIVRDAAPVR